jgi:NAD-dependent deacetylase
VRTADRLDELLGDPGAGRGLVLWLTGAGISAESGIPTFRGPEGYWRVGSRNFHPQELATRAAFREIPDEVWGWYLYRRSVCRTAQPNAAHRALVPLEAHLGDRFLLITQNVDGLHRRAGTSLERHYPIHGDIGRMRCADDCVPGTIPIPDEVPEPWDKGRPLDPETESLLRCPRCGGRARPHVLWFDEYYDEAHFRWESSLAAAARADLLVIVGTSGATNLPLQVAALAARRSVPIVAVNVDASPFTELAEGTGGIWLRGTAGQHVPRITEWISEGRSK